MRVAAYQAPLAACRSIEAMVALLHELFEIVHRRPDGIVLATLAGAREDRLAIAGEHADLVHVVDRDEAGRDPFALLRRRVLVLSADHPQVRAARTAVGGDLYFDSGRVPREDLEALEAACGLEFLVGTDNGHAESRGAAPQGSPDPAHTHDAERLSLELDPVRELLLRPPPRLQGGVGLRDPPREGEEEKPIANSLPPKLWERFNRPEDADGVPVPRRIAVLFEECPGNDLAVSQRGEEHGPFFAIEASTGKAKLRENGAVDYPWHGWQAGEDDRPGQRYDLVCAYEITAPYSFV